MPCGYKDRTAAWNRRVKKLLLLQQRCMWMWPFPKQISVSPVKWSCNCSLNRRRWIFSSRFWSFAASGGRQVWDVWMTAWGWWDHCVTAHFLYQRSEFGDSQFRSSARPDRMITATKGFIAYKLSDYYVQPPSLVYDKIFEILGSTITAGLSQLVFLGHAAGLARTFAVLVAFLSWCSCFFSGCFCMSLLLRSGLLDLLRKNVNTLLMLNPINLPFRLCQHQASDGTTMVLPWFTR